MTESSQNDYRRFKKGDLVTVKWLEPNSAHFYPANRTHEMMYNWEMLGYGGVQAKIAHVIGYPYGHLYKIDADDGDWHWTDDFLAPAVTNNKEAKTLLSQEPL